MGTVFTLEPGYQSNPGAITTNEELLSIAKSIAIADIRTLAIKYGASAEVLDEILEIYSSIPTEDSTCYIDENGLHQSATGGRRTKESVRKAFAMLIMHEAFKRGRNVSLTIG